MTVVQDKADFLVFQLNAVGNRNLLGFVRELQFHAKRRWRVDLAWPDRKLACEVEGGAWTFGRHNRGAGFEADCEKYAELAIAGWRLIRVTPGQIKSGEALEWIERALA